MVRPTDILPLDRRIVADAVSNALREDLGIAGDLSGGAVVNAAEQLTGVFAAREPGVLAGASFVVETFAQIDPAVTIKIRSADGSSFSTGDVLLEVSGAARSILAGERVALNFLCHLSGVATATRALVDAIADSKARIACTRKTLPGLRAAQKYAVRCGGGVNHRFGLFDAAMIKDNHIAAAGGISPALARAKQRLGHMVKIEVEIERLDQLEEAIEGGADVIMLDNMSVEKIGEAVRMNAGRAVLEASGNVTAQSVREIAEAGVDVISSGAITHSARNIDIGLDSR